MPDNRIRVGLLAGAAAMMVSAVSAADLDVPQPADPATAQSGLSHQFDLVFAVTAASDFVTRGYSKTRGDPALQGFVDAYFGPFYVGVLASNVDFGAGDGTEADVYAGILHKAGIFSFNLGYVHYTYTPRDVAADYGEVYGKVYAAVHDKLTVGGQVFHAWDFLGSGTSATYVEANAAYALPHNLSLSGAVGHQSLFDLIAEDYTTWNVGLTWRPKPWLALDLRYHDVDNCARTTCEPRVVGSVSLTGALSALRAMQAAP